MYKLTKDKNELTFEEKQNLLNEVNEYNGNFDNLQFYDNNEEFFNLFYLNKPFELARAITYGKYNYTDDYVKFNAYGNLESFNSYIIEKEINEYIDEIIDEYIELLENKKIDDYYNLFINE